MYTLSVDDMNLPLYGPWTVVGRSVVIHENNAAATRFVCADIEPKGARKMSAIASFDKDPKYQGYVKAVISHFKSRQILVFRMIFYIILERNLYKCLLGDRLLQLLVNYETAMVLWSIFRKDHKFQ